MRKPVAANDETGLGQTFRGGRGAGGLDFVLLNGAQICSEFEEDRLDLVFVQDFQNTIGVASVRPIIERQQDGFGRQF